MLKLLMVKNCKDGQIRNLKTMRCINSNFEIINGKKYKKCKDGKIRNLKTMRCINIKNKSINIKNKSINNSKSNKFFHDLIPVINIKTGNINDRLRYYF